MATNVKYYCMGFLADGTPSVRTFANTKDVEKENEKYIVELKQKVKEMSADELDIVEIISAEEYNMYVNGDGTNTYVRDMETGKPKIYIPPEPTKEELQAQALSLLEKIEQVDIPEEIKAFLRKAATRHYAFNYKNIAEYYAHAPAEIQELMEESALVIIDYNNAIRNGYVQLSEDLKSLVGNWFYPHQLKLQVQDIHLLFHIVEFGYLYCIYYHLLNLS